MSNHEQLFDVKQNLLGRALRDKFSPSSVFFFQLTRFSLHQTTTEFLAFIKATVHRLVNLLEFYIAHSEILLTAWADQLSLNKLCSACAKQNVAVKTARDTYSLLAK